MAARFSDRFGILSCVLLLCVLLSTPAAAQVDHSLYATLLGRHVKGDLVDYAGMKRDAVMLDSYLDLMAGVVPDRLNRDEALAFYVNLYNAWTLKLIVDNYPDLESIKDLGWFLHTPWDKNLVVLGGRVISLDHLEHEIIRPQFQDARVHFALNCTALSCPPLQKEPYRGAVLDRQLDMVARTFVNSKDDNYLDGNILYLCKLFDWYEEDFQPTVRDFVLRFAEPDMARGVRNAGKDLRIEYLPYDWTLNDANRVR